MQFGSRVNRKTCLCKMIANHSISLPLQLGFVASRSPRIAYKLLFFTCYLHHNKTTALCASDARRLDFAIAPKYGLRPLPVHHLPMSTEIGCCERGCAAAVSSRLWSHLRQPRRLQKMRLRGCGAACAARLVQAARACRGPGR